MEPIETLGIPLGEIGYGILLEDKTLQEIAQVVEPGEQLFSYEDVVTAFDLTPDLYTPVHHERLLLEILEGKSRELSFLDTLPESVKDRRFVQISDWSERATCELKEAGYILSDSQWTLSIGNHAAENAKQGIEQGDRLFHLYVTEGSSSFSVEEILSPKGALDLLYSFAKDMDLPRRDKIAEVLKQRGCGDIRRDTICVQEGMDLPPGEYHRYIQRTECQYFIEDLKCVHSAIDRGLSQWAETFRLQGVKEYRVQQGKGNTYTNLSRGIALKNLLAELPIPNPLQRILIVGPGLEDFHPVLKTEAPRQSYEPFAVIDAVVNSLGGRLGQLQMDLVDINPDVAAYFKGVRRLYFATPENSPPPLNIPHSSITVQRNRTLVDLSPLVLKTLSPLEGDIITDRIHDTQTYDLAIMLNTFGYFSSWEKVVAFENVVRLLKRGGLFVTDIGTEGRFEMKYHPHCSLSQETLSVERVPSDDVNHVVYRKIGAAKD